MLDNHLPAPEFKTDMLFTIILRRTKSFETGSKTRLKTRLKTGSKTRSKPRQEILLHIDKNVEISIAELAVKTGLSKKGVAYHINLLKQQGILDRVGPTNGGRWIVLNPNQSF